MWWILQRRLTLRGRGVCIMSLLHRVLQRENSALVLSRQLQLLHWSLLSCHRRDLWNFAIDSCRDAVRDTSTVPMGLRRLPHRVIVPHLHRQKEQGTGARAVVLSLVNWVTMATERSKHPGTSRRRHQSRRGVFAGSRFFPSRTGPRSGPWASLTECVRRLGTRTGGTK